MRIKHSLLNIGAGIGNQFIITLLSFVSRTVFITYLGVEYLGLNGLFTSILAMLSLAEAGIGASIMYSLYKPVAEDDKNKMNALMRLYRNAYLIIAGVVMVLGLSLLPFLPFIVSDTSIDHVHIIYLIFLLNTVAPYLYMHKNSFLNVCQKGYIVTGIYSVSSILTTILKIAILYYTQNFILYLLIESSITIITSIVLALVVNKMYPFLKDKPDTDLDPETKKGIFKNVKAIVLQNIGAYLVLGTDNIIISSFIGLVAVGIYSNYKMLIDISRTFINQIFNNIYHSVGNLVANENKEKIYSIYKVYRLINFWIYSTFTIAIYIMLEPFITLWIGSDFIMDKSVLLLLMLLFYEKGIRNAITTVKTTSGIFHPDRYAPLIQAAINLTLSITFVQFLGIAGVFLGTLISSLAVPFWTTPYLVYKKVFNLHILKYYYVYGLYILIGTGVYFITKYSTSPILADSYFSLLLKGLLCIIIPSLIYTVIFYRSDEFKYIFSISKRVFYKFRTIKVSHTTNRL
ncbi:oligosaccharide flippase family protein [Halobacillus litoralis]|uniref:lipopolysaccharide biosynthesis protein n=1 Tax=Halobacillus litoralis TaxID=45668 RepID=UPI001CFD56E9|nr:oligosaccharide flippase family protein [Halobacillus litoralis]WLR49145.1 oligosaccharide flippase family protein [Halobacillus litoralis]